MTTVPATSGQNPGHGWRRHLSRWLPSPSTVLAALLFAILLAPTAFVFPLAVTPGDVLRFPPDGFSFEHVTAVADNPLWTDALWTSVRVGGLATLIATVVGTAMALVMPRNRAARSGMQIMLTLPLVLPPIVLAVAWYGLFSDFQLVGSILGVAIGHAFLGVPFVYINMAAALSGVRRDLLLAASSLGASRWVVFTRVVLPQITPGLLAGALLTFIISFDELILPLFLGGGIVQTLPVTLWAQLKYSTSPDIAAVAAIITLFTLSSITIAAMLMRSRVHISRMGRN